MSCPPSQSDFVQEKRSYQYPPARMRIFSVSSRSRGRSRFLGLLLTLLTAVTSACASDGGFLFVTFNGEGSPMTEQIYFGLSHDGRNWDALNNTRPVLVSALGEKGVRDPFIFLSHDGKKTYLIATDLSINRNRSWGRAVTAAEYATLKSAYGQPAPAQ